MRIPGFRRRSNSPHQTVFAFVERRLQHERWFKLIVVTATAIAIAAVLRVMPWGRYLSESARSTVRDAVQQSLGFDRSRAEIDEELGRFRQLGIDTTRPRAERAYANASENYQRLMRYAGIDPEHMLLRWGNTDWTLLLSSKVFEPDDAGRAYRFRAQMCSIWLRNVEILSSVPTFYLVPDGPDLADAIKGTAAEPVESSRQTTNSWGLRGGEPDPKAAVRGIVLGDSYMQGMFIGDSETPPARLEHDLQTRLKTSVSILNTGVLGYSPEQYYYSLTAFNDRFRPQFVVVSVFLNDFGGDIDKIRTSGDCDWREGEHWLESIVSYCAERKIVCLVVPIPSEKHLTGRRLSGHYPGQLSNMLSIDSMHYLYPIDDLVDAHLIFQEQAKRKNQSLRHSPLYNGALGDGHFSAAGAQVWATAVGRRLALLRK